MTEDAQAFYVEYKPTLAERLWRKLGFRHHHGDDEPNEPWLGWMQNRSRMHFGWSDRLRLLVSGRLELQHTFHTDAPSPDKIHTRFDWRIVPPGEPK